MPHALMAENQITFSDLGPIRSRIRQVRSEYHRQPLDRDRYSLLRTFSDLAQEYDSLEDFYRLCVILPLEYLQLESRLFLADEAADSLGLVCDSRQGLIFERRPIPVPVAAAPEPYRLRDSCVFPICRQQPAPRDMPGAVPENLVMGALELYPLADPSETDSFFLGRYVQLIGYHLYNRLLAQQNLRHLKFINSLVIDIEHNVIIPNMYFKHIFNQLTRKIRDLHELRASILSFTEEHGIAGATLQEVISRIEGLHQDLAMYDEELRKHHADTSLFLESLFRRDHFERGHFVLRPRRCFVEKEIILPQLEQYRRRLQRRGIVIEQPTDMLEEEIPLMVDVGLLAQVYANLFSNAVKYTEQIVDHRGRTRKAVTYGRDIIRNYFGPGKDVIKFNVFTTGRHLSPREAEAIFVDGCRLEHSSEQPGMGHGLSFLKQVIEVHGGTVGYEPTEEGNNFYFLLPLPTAESE
jgi:signal transduction histidine kinase